MTSSRVVLALALAANLACGSGVDAATPLNTTGAPTSPAAPSPAADPATPGDAPSNAAPRGSVRWTAALGADLPIAVAGDAAGAVYASVLGGPTDAAPMVGRVLRFSAGGQRAWSVDLAPGGLASHVAAAADGGAVIAVCATAECAIGPADGQLRIVRLSSDGAVAWSVPVSGGRFASLEADDAGRVMALVTAAGASARVITLAADGRLGIDVPVAEGTRRATIAADGSGDLIVAGLDLETARPAFARLDSSGAQRWRRVLDTPRGSIDRVASAPGGDIVLAGWFYERLRWGTVTHARLVVGISGFLAVAGADGSPRWSRADDELQPTGPDPSFVGFAGDETIVVHTTTTGLQHANLRAYSAAGTASWRHDFRGVNATEVACVALARSGDVVVAANGAGDAPFQGVPHPRGTHYVAVLAP